MGHWHCVGVAVGRVVVVIVPIFIIFVVTREVITSICECRDGQAQAHRQEFDDAITFRVALMVKKYLISRGIES